MRIQMRRDVATLNALMRGDTPDLRQDGVGEYTRNCLVGHARLD